MGRTLIGLVLDPRPCLMAAGMAVVIRGGGPPEAPAAESPFFTGHGHPAFEPQLPPTIELVRHADIPGCPGCPASLGACVAARP